MDGLHKGYSQISLLVMLMKYVRNTVHHYHGVILGVAWSFLLPLCLPCKYYLLTEYKYIQCKP